MSHLEGAVGELNMTIEVTRKETGKVEVYHLTGFVKQEDLDAYLATSQKLKEQEAANGRTD